MKLQEHDLYRRGTCRATGTPSQVDSWKSDGLQGRLGRFEISLGPTTWRWKMKEKPVVQTRLERRVSKVRPSLVALAVAALVAGAPVPAMAVDTECDVHIEVDTNGINMHSLQFDLEYDSGTINGDFTSGGCTFTLGNGLPSFNAKPAQDTLTSAWASTSASNGSGLAYATCTFLNDGTVLFTSDFTGNVTDASSDNFGTPSNPLPSVDVALIDNCQVVPPVCGNGITQVTEECDDGNTVDGDGCSASCDTELCGDGIVNNGEDCDDGAESVTCNADCTTAACGDGQVNATAGEACDDGDDVDGNGCDSNCTVTACGNGIVAGGEQCDDGNAVAGDGCDDLCVIELVQDKDQQKCINTVNKDIAKLAATAGKAWSKCAAAEAKDAATDMVACVSTATQKAYDKVAADAGSKCPVAPDFAAFDDPDDSDNTLLEAEEFMMALLGTDIEAGVVAADQKDDSKCQLKVLGAAAKLQATAFKEFNSCKKNGLKDGSVYSDVYLSNCVGADAKGKVAGAGTKLSDTVTGSCGASTLSSVFPGDCAIDTPASFASCVEAASLCAVCRNANAVDGTSADCDLLDNGVTDASCINN